MCVECHCHGEHPSRGLRPCPTRDAAANNNTLDQTIATADLTADADYVPMSFMFRVRFDREFVIMRAWEEATGKSATPGT